MLTKNTADKNLTRSLVAFSSALQGQACTHTTVCERDIAPRTFRCSFAPFFKTSLRRPHFSSYVISHRHSRVLRTIFNSLPMSMPEFKTRRKKFYFINFVRDKCRAYSQSTKNNNTSVIQSVVRSCTSAIQKSFYVGV